MQGHGVIFRCVVGLFALVAISGWAAEVAFAVQPDEILKDARLERRARLLSSELRCVVCQNQSIDDSNAPLARDLRVLLRERLTAGDSDQQVRDFLVARYGEFVLLRPTFKRHTYVLWILPPFLLLIAAFVMWRRWRHLSGSAGEHGAVAGGIIAPLSKDEEARLDKILTDPEDTVDST